MKDVFAKLGADFFSTIMFLVVYFATGNVLLATGAAIASAVAQVIYARFKGEQLSFMTYASLALAIVLGTTTLLTRDPRFVLAKPAIAHFAIGTIMLKRGWMLRYIPPFVTAAIPEYVIIAGYAWAALMFVLGLGTIAVAMTGDIKLWAFYVSVVAFGAKIVAFAVQYFAFRMLVINRIRAARAFPIAGQPIGLAQPDALYRPGLPGSQDHSGFATENLRRFEMAVDGSWNITMSTPMGERNATLAVKSSGSTLTGTQGADGNSTEIFDGTVNGDDVAWKLSITNPMPLTLAFTGKVAGDSISGEMGIGPMGSFPFKGTRA
jgi:intracellular septation protein